MRSECIASRLSMGVGVARHPAAAVARHELVAATHDRRRDGAIVAPYLLVQPAAVREVLGATGDAPMGPVVVQLAVADMPELGIERPFLAASGAGSDRPEFGIIA